MSVINISSAVKTKDVINLSKVIDNVLKSIDKHRSSDVVALKALEIVTQKFANNGIVHFTGCRFEQVVQEQPKEKIYQQQYGFEDPPQLYTPNLDEQEDEGDDTCTCL